MPTEGLSIQTQLTGVSNQIDTLYNQIKLLFEQYLPGVPNTYRGVISIGSEELAFPCILVQPVDDAAVQISAGKLQDWYTFDIYWYVADGSWQAVVKQSSDVGEILKKLFSNNALNDLSSSSSKKFQVNPGYWLDSKMSQIRYAPPLVFDRPNRPKYRTLGHFQLKLQTVIIP